MKQHRLQNICKNVRNRGKTKRKDSKLKKPWKWKRRNFLSSWKIDTRKYASCKSIEARKLYRDRRRIIVLHFSSLKWGAIIKSLRRLRFKKNLQSPDDFLIIKKDDKNCPSQSETFSIVKGISPWQICSSNFNKWTNSSIEEGV